VAACDRFGQWLVNMYLHHFAAQILLAVPGSVLWLLRFGTSNAAELNLAKEATRMGLDDPARIRFTETVSDASPPATPPRLQQSSASSGARLTSR
jgi:hypothetical protein